MPELHWIHYADPAKSNEKFVDNNLLCQGKIVFLRHCWLTGESPTEKVTALTRMEDPTSFFGRILRRLHIRKIGAPSVLGVTERVEGEVESTTGWSVGALNPARFAAYHFEDGFGHQSPPIWVSDSARGSAENMVEAGIGATYQGAGGYVKTKRHTFVIWTCNKDPDLSLELMLPWQSGTHDLRAFAAEYLGYLAPYLDIEETLDAESDGYLPREVPEGWDFSLERDFITLGEGEGAAVDVTVSAPTPGRAAFAVRVVEQGNPDNFVVSPIIEVEQTQEDLQEEERRQQAEEEKEKEARRHEMVVEKQRRLSEIARARRFSIRPDPSDT
jgi:hypothetical protein